MLNDEPERLEASDPEQSFIVQAPAGSGKTELLTQRFLRLLSTVTTPEHIIALTFTRKAASEMRERILKALQAAKEGSEETEVRSRTETFARLALRNDNHHQWQLLQNPSRLRIMTIDALCYSLTQAIPLLEQQLPYTNITEHAHLHYQQAVHACLSYLVTQAAWDERLQVILEHMDNRQDLLIQLLCDLLATRDQWLGLIYQARDQTKTCQEQVLQALVQHSLEHFVNSTPLPLREELLNLSKTLGYCQGWTSFEVLDATITADLARLLLTKDNKFRKRFDHHVGLKRELYHDQFESLKARSQALLTALALLPNFLESLLKVATLPSPEYDRGQWRILQILFDLLPLVTAHLHLTFQQEQCIDFIGITEHALLALGDDEAPTDLALFLDHSIQHLLVDEFQDTSFKQYQLLKQLVQAWSPTEGKTLFVVGDPMQSIYRFRQAEVGLFLKIRQEGLGPVRLKALELSSNFRSEPTIISWVNQHFKSIFPISEDINSGAVTFHPALAVKPPSPNARILAQCYPNRKQEAEALAILVQEELQQYPNDSIAILVRSRHQLTDILPSLRARNLRFQGVEIEKSFNMQHLQDVWSLTKAFLRPADRLSWLALLRSPYGGLHLEDLFSIANYQRKKSIYYALSKQHELKLSDDGRKRAQFIYNSFYKALKLRQQEPLAVSIEHLVHTLNAKHMLSTAETADLEQFFMLLHDNCPEGRMANPELIESAFRRHYGKRLNASRLQIMTIHKSKGLEFDCVILPGLGSKAVKADKPLLRWLHLPTQEPGFLLSPLQASHEEPCLLYDYLGNIHAEKEDFEQQRLLYVAVTRAKKRLYLFDNQEKITKGSFRERLGSQTFELQDKGNETDPEPPGLPKLSRLASALYIQAPYSAHTEQGTRPFAIQDSKARLSGIAVHELLQWICTQHPATVDNLPWHLLTTGLKSQGFSAQEQQDTSEHFKKQLGMMLGSALGHWLCKAHEEEQNELALLVTENGLTETKIIDRTFIENGRRWIIDFKTGAYHDKGIEKHRQQVQEYARIMSLYDPRPIHCGLYYLNGQHWLNWQFQEHSKHCAIAAKAGSHT